jgi:lysophospholipase L1-like esterase
VVVVVFVAFYFSSPGLGSEQHVEPMTIVAFGDSTTATRGPLKIYAKILAEALPKKGMAVEVVNAGIGGNTTEMARQRFTKDVLDKSPNWVIVQFGINDSAIDVWKGETKPRVTRERYVENLRYFVRTLKSRSVKMVLMTPNPLRWTEELKEMYGKPPYDTNDPEGFNLLLNRYAAAVREIAKEEGVPLVDVYAAFEEFDRREDRRMEDLLLDGMHPNAKGQAIVAKLLVEKILDIRGGRGER